MKKKLILLFILIVSICSIYLLNNELSVMNFKYAKIHKIKSNYVLKVNGRRKLMTHDILSLFKDKTYIETEKFYLPRSTGKIKGEELLIEKGNYNLSGEINIQNKKVKIDLYYLNTDDHIKSKVSWNGEYILKN